MQKIMFTRTGALLSLLTCLAIAGIVISALPKSMEANIVEQVIKSVDETTTSTTLQDDDELVLPLQQNRSYIIDGTIISSASSTGFCQGAFTFPQGAVAALTVTSQAAGPIVTRTSGEAIEIGCDTTTTSVHVIGSVQMGAQGGDLQFQFASDGPQFTVERGSILRADKL